MSVLPAEWERHPGPFLVPRKGFLRCQINVDHKPSQAKLRRRARKQDLKSHFDRFRHLLKVRGRSAKRNPPAPTNPFDTFRHPTPNEINAVRNEIALDPATDSTLFDIPALAKINALRSKISAPRRSRKRRTTRNHNQINRVRNETNP